MKKIILAAAALFAVVAAAGQTTIETQPTGIQVNGRAERKITPDEIHVAITLRDNEPKGKTVAQLETQMKREFAALGIDIEKSLRVTSMANAPRRRNDVDTSRSYDLKVSSTATLGQVFYALGEMGVTGAGVTRLAHSRIEEYRAEVRTEAVKNARKIADELAGALGQKVMHALWIQDGGFYETSPVPIYKTRAMAMDAMSVEAYGVADAGAQGLEMQEITLVYNVTVRFYLRHM